MPNMRTVYRTYEKDGKKVTEAVELATVDAAEAVQNHPTEWSYTDPNAAPAAAEPKAAADQSGKAKDSVDTALAANTAESDKAKAKTGKI